MYKYGMKGPEIKKIQERLVEEGFLSASGVDSIFGNKTQAAVKSFQKKWGLVVDGVVGGNTWKIMFPDTTIPVTPSNSLTAKQERFLAEQATLVLLVLGRRYPDLLDRVKRISEFPELAAGYTMVAGEMLRTPEQQAIYVEQGKSKTYDSRHLKRLAVDLYMFINGGIVANPSWMGELWKSLSPDNVWGGDWKTIFDPNHFEKTPPK